MCKSTSKLNSMSCTSASLSSERLSVDSESCTSTSVADLPKKSLRLSSSRHVCKRSRPQVAGHRLLAPIKYDLGSDPGSDATTFHNDCQYNFLTFPCKEILTVCVPSPSTLSKVCPSMSKLLDGTLQPLVLGVTPDPFLYMPRYSAPSLAAILVWPSRNLCGNTVLMFEAPLALCEDVVVSTRI